MNGILSRFTSLFVPRSLRYQLLSRSFAILAVLLLLIGVFQYLYMQQFLYKNRAETIKSQIVSSPIEIWMPGSSPGFGQGGAGPGGDDGHTGTGGDTGRGGSVRSGIPGSKNGVSSSSTGQPQVRDDGVGRSSFFFFPDSTLAFYDGNGTFSVIAVNEEVGSPPQFQSDVISPYLNGQERDARFEVIKNAQGKEQLVVLVPRQFRGRIVGVSQLSVLTGPIKQVLFRQLFTFLALAAGALIIGLLTYLPILRRTLVPLSNMVGTVGKIDAGNLDERFPVHQGQLEVDRLAVSFNGMLERLSASFQAEKAAKEQMSRFIADASHELRTPLTSLHGFLEILLRGASQNPEQLEKALRSMYGESERMNKLVRDLLLLAKMDREPGLHPVEGLLDELIDEMELQFKILAGRREVRVSVEPEIAAIFDRDKMKQVVLNLFHNAVQHTDPEQGKIEVNLKHTAREIELAVKDNGHGIPQEHLPHLFDRFYRVDSSRTRKLGGSGLGLAITKSIVESHGGTIEIESDTGAGSVFRIILPRQ